MKFKPWNQRLTVEGEQRALQGPPMTDFIVTHTWVKCRVLSELLKHRQDTLSSGHTTSPL